MNKRAIFTVCVDNYFPELMQYTLPNLAAYAEKIGADYHIITERKFPEFPPTYEKIQIRELGKSYQQCFLIDADVMLSKDFPDVMATIPFDHVASQMQFDASLLFQADEYFLRDGRRIGMATTMVVSSILNHQDLWTPLEFGAEEAKKRTKRWFICDEYCVSRNVARYGLKTSGLIEEEDLQYIKHFDCNSKTPTKESIIAVAKKLHEEKF